MVDGMITSYDGLKGKFGVYFPTDGQYFSWR